MCQYLYSHRFPRLLPVRPSVLSVLEDGCVGPKEERSVCVQSGGSLSFGERGTFPGSDFAGAERGKTVREREREKPEKKRINKREGMEGERTTSGEARENTHEEITIH